MYWEPLAIPATRYQVHNTWYRMYLVLANQLSGARYLVLAYLCQVPEDRLVSGTWYQMSQVPGTKWRVEGGWECGWRGGVG